MNPMITTKKFIPNPSHPKISRKEDLNTNILCRIKNVAKSYYITGSKKNCLKKKRKNWNFPATKLFLEYFVDEFSI